jgi:hypothetical protein
MALTWASCIPPPAHPSEIAFRHAWWVEERRLVRAALERCGVSSRVLERFDNCGSDAWLYLNKKTGDVRIHANTCKNRFCLPCSINRSRIMAGNIRDWMHELVEGREKRGIKTYFMHLTLTLVSSRLPLDEQIDAIYAAFRRLRNYKVKVKRHSADAKLSTVRWWDQYVVGGAASFEPTGKEKRQLFHPHLHVIVECRGRPFIPHWELSDAWRACTRKVNPALESSVVHFRVIDNADAAANEIAKYAAKGVAELAGDFIHNQKKLDTMIRAMKGPATDYDVRIVAGNPSVRHAYI